MSTIKKEDLDQPYPAQSVLVESLIFISNANKKSNTIKYNIKYLLYNQLSACGTEFSVKTTEACKQACAAGKHNMFISPLYFLPGKVHVFAIVKTFNKAPNQINMPILSLLMNLVGDMVNRKMDVMYLS